MTAMLLIWTCTNALAGEDWLVATLISLLREMEYGLDGVCFFCAQRKHTADCKLGTFLSNLTTKDQND